VVSSRGAAAADTRATAPPLTKPSQPTRLVAVRSRGGLWEEKSGKSFGVAWILAGSSTANSEKSSPDWGLWHQGSLHAVVNAITHIDIKPPRLAKQGFVAGAAAAIAVAGGLALAIRLRFHNHAPEQRASWLAFHQQAADELGGELFCGAGEESSWQGWEVLDGRGGYGSGLGGDGHDALRLLKRSLTFEKQPRPQMKTILKAYLYASIAITTTAVAACFIWYKQEYDLAYKLDKGGEIQRAEIHRTNSLWLGLWGGIYGLTGVTAAAALLKEGSKE